MNRRYFTQKEREREREGFSYIYIYKQSIDSRYNITPRSGFFALASGTSQFVPFGSAMVSCSPGGGPTPEASHQSILIHTKAPNNRGDGVTGIVYIVV